MSAEKSKKEAKREECIRMLTDLGVETKGLSDDDLIFKVVTELNKTNSLLAKQQSEKEISNLDKYVLGIKHKIKDSEFILRLMNLNIPSYYLHLFRDEDKELTNKELWAIVNHSGINPFKNRIDLFETRLKFEPTKPKRRFNDE